MDLVDVTGFLPHDEANRIIDSAGMLLVGGPLDSTPLGRGVVPAKLFEYLASDLPILYIGERPSDAADLLEGFDGCYLVGPSDVDGARRALASGLASGPQSRETDRLSRRCRTRELAEVLQTATRSTSAN
jgi:hypothetical protein